MSAEELRSFVQEALEQLDDRPRTALVDALIARAAKGNSGWKPSSPGNETVREVEAFTAAVRRTGYAAPEQIDDYLRQGMKAFLGGDYATARAIYQTLLPPLAEGEIDLGQHELVDEVLTVRVHDCAAQYLVTVYAATPLEARPEALCLAIDAVDGISTFWEPLREMERVATQPLPELDAFLPSWLARVEREPSSENEWEGHRDRWLREAAERLEGVAGLARLARQTRRPEAFRAWCSALAERGDWADALGAYEEAAEVAEKSHWRGDFLDGAALAAQQLARRDATKRLEAAWLGAPSMLRLLRWLGAGTPSASMLATRVIAATQSCPAKAARQCGLLHILAGDMKAAAKVLAKAPGLGWSSEEHPGRLLFPAFARILADGTEAKLSSELFDGLKDTHVDIFSMDRDDGDGTSAKPQLRTPTVAELIELARPGAHIDPSLFVVMLEGMRSAATRRTEGVLVNKRRRHYGHAATLIVCCLELAPVVGQKEAVSEWVDELRREYKRFSAFQRELEDSLAMRSTK
jgi:tetratricopeptide (TPR) repeat protein